MPSSKVPLKWAVVQTLEPRLASTERTRTWGTEPSFRANVGNPKRSLYWPVPTLAVVAGAAATPGISSPLKYFAFAAFITGIAAYGFE